MTPHETSFKLTKDYLAESFDQSLPHGGHAKPNFIFPATLFVVGIFLLVFTDQPDIAGWVFVALCVLELLHIKFRRGWWLFRQTWGKNNELDIQLTIDETGIQTKSSAVVNRLAWEEIDRVIETESGVILVLSHGGQQYLSKSVIRDDWLIHITTIETAKT
jgi:hypothetical protein